MIGRKYMILDTRAKALALDEHRDPLRFVSLDEALTKAIELRGRKSAEAFAVVDDLGTKWMWSAKKVLRVALSYDTKHVIDEAIDVDWKKISSIRQIRCRPDGMVETSHNIRLPDGPPIPVMLHGRSMGTTTTQRWTDKPQWIERGALSSYVDALPTRVHKLEQRAINEKARAERVEQKARLQLAAYEAGEEMTCQLCGRRICAKFGAIAHHGYTRPGDGYQTASCAGTHHSPLEVTNDVLLKYIRKYEARCEETKRLIADVSANRAEVVATISPHWGERRNYPHMFRFTADSYGQVAAASEGKLSEHVSFSDRKKYYVAELEGRLRDQKAVLAELRERNANWKQDARLRRRRIQAIRLRKGGLRKSGPSSPRTEKPRKAQLRERSLEEFDSMKAILIDPNMKSVARIDISKDARLSDYFGEKPRVAMKFPKGDVLFAGVEERAQAFIIGGSRPIAGPGLIVGRSIGPGERSSAHVRLDDVVTMVRWTAIEVRPRAPAAVRAIMIDPEQGLVEEVMIPAHK
ncbi:hypothetical protein AB7M16_003359 [Bradyrhizobium sp. USDA 372]